MHVGEILTEEVKALAGERYKRNGKPGHVRWAKQWGSVYIGKQKLPILYQRVRDMRKGREDELTRQLTRQLRKRSQIFRLDIHGKD